MKPDGLFDLDEGGPGEVAPAEVAVDHGAPRRFGMGPGPADPLDEVVRGQGSICSGGAPCAPLRKARRGRTPASVLLYGRRHRQTTIARLLAVFSGAERWAHFVALFGRLVVGGGEGSGQVSTRPAAASDLAVGVRPSWFTTRSTLLQDPSRTGVVGAVGTGSC